MARTLFVVGTPIGNLEDITLRALRVLREVEHIAAEDTRRTRALLSHFEIKGKTLHHLDAHSPHAELERLMALMRGGADIALLTDAGMPGISDPGSALVRAVQAEGLGLSPVPGPSAVTAAVAVSGLVEGPFCFVGFLPRSGAKRRGALERLMHTAEPAVLFEAPQRAEATLHELSELMPDRQIAICRELSKLHEELCFGTLRHFKAPQAYRGEFTIVLGPYTPRETSLGGAIKASLEELEKNVRARLQNGAAPRAILEELAPTTTLRRRDLYALIQRLR